MLVALAFYFSYFYFFPGKDWDEGSGVRAICCILNSPDSTIGSGPTQVLVFSKVDAES